MSLNLFPSGSWPSEEFRANLQQLAELNNEDLNFVRDWFLNSKGFGTLDWPDFAEVQSRSGFSVEDFERTVSIVQYLLTRWKAERLSVESVIADLKTFGIEAESLEKLRTFLQSLEDVGERVYLDTVRRFHENAGLSTIDDVNVVCDLRPLFKDPAYEARPMGNSYDTMLGFTVVYILEIVTSGVDDQKQRCSFQLSEGDFDHLLEGLTRAKQQFQILKSWKDAVGNLAAPSDRK